MGGGLRVVMAATLMLPALGLASPNVVVAASPLVSGDGEAGLEVPAHPFVEPSLDPAMVASALPSPLALLDPAAGGSPVPSTLTVDTSDYMLGTVYVQVVFVESTGLGGCGDANTETWSAARQTTVLAEIDAGLAWWSGQVPSGNPLAFTRGPALTRTTCYEAINRNAFPGGQATNHFAWVRDIITGLGYTPGVDLCTDPDVDCGVLDAVRRYDHDLRNSNDKQW
ncbi:MAG: hypothetical protein ACRDH5_11030, partial [bacterium]